ARARRRDRPRRAPARVRRARSAGCTSAALKARLALLEEGGDAFLVVRGLSAAEVRHRLAVERAPEVAAERRVHALLHVPVADERPVRDPPRDLADLVEKPILRDDAVHEPEPEPSARGEDVGEEEELLRLRRADPPRELPRRPVAAAKADAREGGPEARAIRREDEVAGERDPEPRSDRRAVHRRDRHLRHLEEAPRQLVTRALTVDVLLEGLRHGSCGAHRRDVAAGRE